MTRVFIEGETRRWDAQVMDSRRGEGEALPVRVVSPYVIIILVSV